MVTGTFLLLCRHPMRSIAPKVKLYMQSLHCTKCPCLHMDHKHLNLMLGNFGLEVLEMWWRTYLPPCTPGSGSAQTWRTHWRIHPHPAAASSWPSWVPGKLQVKIKINQGHKVRWSQQTQAKKQSDGCWEMRDQKQKGRRGDWKCLYQ